jgi:hypothetical protein
MSAFIMAQTLRELAPSSTALPFPFRASRRDPSYIFLGAAMALIRALASLSIFLWLLVPHEVPLKPPRPKPFHRRDGLRAVAVRTIPGFCTTQVSPPPHDKSLNQYGGSFDLQLLCRTSIVGVLEGPNYDATLRYSCNDSSEENIQLWSNSADLGTFDERIEMSALRQR